jgi:hypothetical protein
MKAINDAGMVATRIFSPAGSIILCCATDVKAAPELY